jgi:peroxiredoxin
MKTNIYLLFIVVLLTLFFTQCSETSKKCVIKGTVEGVDAKSIILVKAGGDFKQSEFEIPVTDNSFEFDTVVHQPIGYYLAYGNINQKGGGRMMPLFLEPGEEIKITLFPEHEFDNNIVEGGKLNKKYQKYHAEIREKFYSRFEFLGDSVKYLIDNDNFYSDTMKAVLNQLNIEDDFNERLKLNEIIEGLRENDEYLSAKAKKINEKDKLIKQEYITWQQDYIQKNNTILSYFLLIENLVYSKEFVDFLMAKESYKKLSGKFTGHPYNELVGNLLQSMENIKAGGKYINFTAPDLDGNLHTLSDEIEGKIALIDFWGSWCRPCITHSRTMIPVYEEFKHLGFTIVGIAGEYNNTKQLEKRLETENFPWLQLIELNRQNNLWDKYGISNSGGKSFLVDKNGVILAIHPSAEEVKDILLKKLK